VIRESSPARTDLKRHKAPWDSSRVVALFHAAFDRWEAISQSFGAGLVMFAWAFAEAIWWPVIPEALLLPLAIGAKRNFWRLLLLAVAGTAAGGTILYLFAYFWPDIAATLLMVMPLYSDARQARVEELLDRLGPLAYAVQPYSGLDFKFFGIGGAVAGIPPWVAVPMFAFSRALRMFLAAGLVRVSAHFFRRQYRDLSVPLAIGYVIVFAYSWAAVQFRQF
jgi:membrane protein YqaA with SNARE-associated domain